MDINPQSSSQHIDQGLDELSRDIRKLEIDYQMYFNGGRELPPNDLRRKLDRTVLILRNFTFKNYALQFKFSSIASKYVSLCEIWNRRCRTIEEGIEEAATLARKKKNEAASSGDSLPSRSGSFEISADGNNDDALQKMYNSYVAAAKKSGSQGKVSFDGFKNTIAKQTEAITKDKKCKTVGYQIAIEDGKVKIKAKTGKQEK